MLYQRDSYEESLHIFTRSYADLYLSCFGASGQAYANDPEIWMIEKLGLFGHV